jgi:hypothetical protein
MWKNIVQARQATDDDIIRRMRLACRTTKATHTHSVSKTYCFSGATMVTLYAHYLSCKFTHRLFNYAVFHLCTVELYGDNEITHCHSRVPPWLDVPSQKRSARAKERHHPLPSSRDTSGLKSRFERDNFKTKVKGVTALRNTLCVASPFPRCPQPKYFGYSVLTPMSTLLIP